MKKANKALANDWRDSERERERQDEDTDKQSLALGFAGNKRDGCNFPCPQTLESLGYHEAAKLVRQAYGLLEDADIAFRKQRGK